MPTVLPPTLLPTLLAVAAGAQEPVKPVRLQPPPQPQEKSQDELAQLRAEKLAKPVFAKAPWLTDYDAARAKAKAEAKPIFVYFTRSYAP